MPSPVSSEVSSELAAEGAGQAPTRDAALSLLLRLGEATAADLAQQLRVSVQVMRRHLRSLQDDRLVEASPAPEGPGRPSNRWRLTAEGQGRFPDGSEHFALGLLQSMAASLPAAAMEVLLHQQAADKAAEYRRRIGAGSLRQRLERLVELRRNEGYVAECRPDDGVAGAWLVHEFHCSVMRIAEAFPIVCDQELQLMRQTFPDCSIERVHWRLEGGHSCGFRLSADPAAPPPEA
ncbi:MAG: iron-sulfur cluster biosynthesis transcriptional regulator SufR [Cyanobacteriota bacterium]|nr:iron-sulfur cluster biosynthesis transcriptional regulator SufR [Cyanobacteriota bacterium]